MIKHIANKYSWYPVNSHGFVDSPALTRVNLGQGVEVRYSLRAKKPIIVRSKNQITDPKEKLSRIEKLKEIINGIHTNSVEELKNILRTKRNLIINVVI